MRGYGPLISKSIACVLGVIAAMAFLSFLKPETATERYANQEVNSFMIDNELRTFAVEQNSHLPSSTSKHIRIDRLAHNHMELTWFVTLLTNSINTINETLFEEKAQRHLSQYWCIEPKFHDSRTEGPTIEDLRYFGKHGVTYSYVYTGTRGNTIAEVQVNPKTDCGEYK